MISRAKKYVAVLLAFVCVCMIFSPQTAYAAEDSSQHETVKVGFFAMDGYHVIKNAATIAMLYFTLFFCGGLAISVYEELPLLDCLYEAASAVGTVGLTLGITPKLHMFSQIVLIILMYLGRVGGLTLIYAVLSRRNRGNAKLPLEKITVG